MGCWQFLQVNSIVGNSGELAISGRSSQQIFSPMVTVAEAAVLNIKFHVKVQKCRYPNNLVIVNINFTQKLFTERGV